MALLIGLGDYGIKQYVDEARELYELLLDLCSDRLDWDNILNRPELYTKDETYNRDEINDLLQNFSPINLPIEIDDVNNLWDELLNRYTIEDIDLLLLDKANKIHTHNVADIIGLEDAIAALSFSIVEEIAPGSPDGVYLVLPAGASQYTSFIRRSGINIPLDAVTQQQLVIALNSKQNKLNGNTDQLVLGDGTFIDRNGAAVGLGNVANYSPADMPISNAQAAINAIKANDDDVLKKTGNQTKTSGILTFVVSPKVPVANAEDDAVNLGQVVQLIDDLSEMVSHFGEEEFTPAATEWYWSHNLGRRPIVGLIIDGEQWFSTVEFPDLNTVKVTFKNPKAGILQYRT